MNDKRILWNALKSKTKIKVNNGEKIRFWKVEWHEIGILENLFPDLHNIATLPQSTIAEM